MANETTTTTLDDLCQAIIAEARMVLSQSVDLTDYIDKRMVPRGKSSVTFPEYGSMTATRTGDTDASNQSVSTSGTTITPTVVTAMTTILDTADWASAPLQVGSDIGKLAAGAIHDLRNQEVWALFDGFTQAVGTTNTDITEANIAAGVRYLLSAKAPRPYYLAITPHVFEDLLALYSTSTNWTSNAIRDAVLQRGELPPIYGVYPLLIDNLASGTSAGKADGADAKCGLFSRGALGCATMWDINVEPQRDASIVGNEIVVSTCYAVGEVKDTWGVEVLVDNKD